MAAAAAIVVAAPWRDARTADPGITAGTPDPTGSPGSPGSPGTPGTAGAVTGGSATTAGAIAALACASPPERPGRLTPLGKPATITPNGYQLFDGWSFHRDFAGFGIAVPNGWQYFRSGSTACFRDPEGVRILSVDPSRRPTTDPLTGCQREEARLTGKGALPGYRRLRMQEVPQFEKGAEWEYTYVAGPPAGGAPTASGPPANGPQAGATGRTPMRGQTVWFVSSQRHAYALGWVTREFDWRANQTNLSMILGSFMPADQLQRPSG